ncbi:BrnT family toxin [Faunimonas pinastri]|uniref:BrnT family toxin n=1 Tax=Faunimonas pinastri TaxID=1855383 RepID=UPI000B81A68C|nr:BrnT family toxin [Faunimonas pinastri]
MLIWDEAKYDANVAKHGIEFTEAERFDFASARTVIDDRFDYGEVREIAFGYIGTRLHVLVFSRRGSDLRVISLRKANARERTFYEQAQA